MADGGGLARLAIELKRTLMDDCGRQPRGLQNRLRASEIPALPGLSGIDLETSRCYAGFPRARLLSGGRDGEPGSHRTRRVEFRPFHVVVRVVIRALVTARNRSNWHARCRQ